MGLEQIGLEAIFKNADFLKGMSEYTTAISKGENQTTRSSGLMSSALSGIGKIAGGALAAAAGVATAAIGGIAGIIASSVGPASDLNETISKVGVVFGSSAQDVLNFGATAATALGMSQNEALTAAGTYGNLFRSMGMTEQASAGMSTGLIKLAADLASFNNQDPGEVLEKLRAGLTGETEPLKSLGVNLNAAAVEAKAVAMGLAQTNVDGLKVAEMQVKLEAAVKATNKATRMYGAESIQARQAAINEAKAQENLDAAMKGAKVELSAAAKAQATYALVMEQTSLAQGDFSRTSGGLANQTRIMKAQWADLSAKIGTAVLPAVNTLMNTLTSLFDDPAFNEFINGMIDGLAKLASEWIPKVAQWLQVNLPIAIQTLSAFWTNTLLPALTNVWAWMQSSLFPTLQTVWNWLMVNLPPAIQTISDYWNTVLWPTMQNVFGWIQTNVFPILQDVWNWLSVNLPPAIQTIADYWTGILQPAIQAVGDWMETTLFPTLQKLWNWLSTNIPPAVQKVVEAWNTKFMPAIKAVHGWINTTLMPLFKAVSDFLDAVFTASVKKAGDVWSSNFMPAISSVVDFINGTVRPALETFGGFMENTFGPIFARVGDMIKSGLQAALDWVTTKIKELTDLLNKLTDLINGTSGDGSGDGNCFIGETPVNTGLGYRQIVDIRENDIVLVLSEKDGPIGARVIKKITNFRDDLVQVITNRGKFTCSPNHLWKTEAGFLPAAILKPDTRLVSRNFGAVVIEVKSYPGTFQVFNLHVDHPEHTYMVGGHVVHNAKPNSQGNSMGGTSTRGNTLGMTSSTPTPAAAVTNISNVFNMGGQTINNGMDAAQMRQFILRTVREAL